MPAPKIGTYTPPELTDTLYVHLRPKLDWQRRIIGMTAVKAVKSIDALVEPGDYIVKIELAVPATLFVDSMPSARIEISPGEVVAIVATQIEEV